jgi:hypothetical protein
MQYLPEAVNRTPSAESCECAQELLDTGNEATIIRRLRQDRRVLVAALREIRAADSHIRAYHLATEALLTVCAEPDLPGTEPLVEAYRR